MSRILIIDDDEWIAEVLKDHLESIGHEVIWAQDGRSGLALAALECSRTPLDGVLLDFHMPGMDGLAVLQELSRKHPTVPVILMSGTTEETMFREGLRHGARAYLRKPLDVEDLESTCRRWFGNGTRP